MGVNMWVVTNSSVKPDLFSLLIRISSSVMSLVCQIILPCVYPFACCFLLIVVSFS